MVKKCQNTKTFQLNTIKLLEGLNFAPLKNDKVSTQSLVSQPLGWDWLGQVSGKRTKKFI
jgi:hypothetical protein